MFQVLCVAMKACIYAGLAIEDAVEWDPIPVGTLGVIAAGVRIWVGCAVWLVVWVMAGTGVWAIGWIGRDRI
jgi:hypothetical protein